MDASHADQLRPERKSGWIIFLYSTLTLEYGFTCTFCFERGSKQQKGDLGKTEDKNVVRSSKSHKSFQNIHLGHRRQGWTIIHSHRKF